MGKIYRSELGKPHILGRWDVTADGDKMAAWEFQTLQNIAEKNGWHKFISMQNYYNLIYREEEREMVRPFFLPSSSPLICSPDPILPGHGRRSYPLVPHRPRRPHPALVRPQQQALDDRQVPREPGA